MSDIEAGGSTVFTKHNLSLWPRKGSAAFWYNLLPNGELDERTRHSACPVLIGSKWGAVALLNAYFPIIVITLTTIYYLQFQTYGYMKEVNTFVGPAYWTKMLNSLHL